MILTTTVDDHPFSHLPARYRFEELCAHCGEPSAYLCDSAIGLKPPSYADWGEWAWSCDAPMCEGCRDVVGRVEYRGQVMTLDYCAYHREHHKAPWTDFVGQKVGEFSGDIVKPDRVDDYRARIWAACASDQQAFEVRVPESWFCGRYG